MDYTPQRLVSSNEKDLYIKSNEKIDEDNFIFDILKDNEDKLLDVIEQGDEVIKSHRERMKEREGKEDGEDKNNEYLMSIRKKWESTLPTVLEYYNESIISKINKILP